MTQIERRIYLIKELLSEEPRCSDVKLPSDEQQQKIFFAHCSISACRTE